MIMWFQARICLAMLMQNNVGICIRMNNKRSGVDQLNANVMMTAENEISSSWMWNSAKQFSDVPNWEK